MLHGDIFISHLRCLILRMDQYIVQVLSHKNLAALYLGTLREQFFHTVHDVGRLKAHFLQQL